VLAEDSSSASANTHVFIRATEWASVGILKVFPAEGPSFFARVGDLGAELTECLASVTAEALELGEDDASTLDFARRAYAAERDAMALLARAEHTRIGLSLKLMKKDHRDDARNRALDRLSSAGSLSDARFAEAWLRSRVARRAEGRGKLLAGLLARGVPGDIAQEALARLYEGEDEREICLAAMEKLERTGKSGDKMVIALLRKGFSLGLVKSCSKTDKD